MSKKVLGIGLTIAGVALMAIPGIGQALGLATLSIAGASISEAMLIGLTLEIGATLLLGPGKPKPLSTSPCRMLLAPRAP